MIVLVGNENYSKGNLSMKIRLENIADKLIALIFALSPFITNYIIYIFGRGFSPEFFLVLIFGGLYGLNSFFRRNRRNVKSIATSMWILMGIYLILNQLFGLGRYIYNSSNTNLFSVISFLLVLMIGIQVFYEDKAREYYYDIIEKIAIFMSAVVIIQVIVYYVTGSTITSDRLFFMPFQSLFTSGVKKYLEVSKWVMNGFFRPSAFFLEPAHFSQYCSIGLVCSLVKEDKLLNKTAIFISVGIILTTSGLGIGTVAFIWCSFLYVNSEGISRKRIFIGTVLLIVIAFFLYNYVEVFRAAVIRITVESGGETSAIEGRMKNAVLLDRLSTMERIFGMGYKNIPLVGTVDDTTYYMTGIIELLYCQGVFGTLLFLACYVSMLIRAFKVKKNLPFYILIVYLPFLFGSSNLGMMTLIQYIPFLYIPLNKENA
jgi:hypothetical protein